MSKLEIPSVSMMWTVDTRSKPDLNNPTRSSAIRSRGGEWSLFYYFSWAGHVLGVRRVSDAPPDPFYVSVLFEGLSKKKHCTVDNIWTLKNDKIYEWNIWVKSDSDIKLWDEEFRRVGRLRFLVVIHDEYTATPTDVGEPRPTSSTSACLESLSNDLSRYMDRGSDPDVKFKFGGESIAAHGSVVCARSPVIASLLASDMLEGRTRVIKIPDIEPDVFRHFLRYLYTGTLPDLTLNLALNLYEAGDQYAVHGLARRCSGYLLEHLSVQDACEVLVVADAHSNAEFREAVIDFIVANKVPRASDRWKDFCKGHPVLAIEVLNRLCPSQDQRNKGQSTFQIPHCLRAEPRNSPSSTLTVVHLQEIDGIWRITDV